MPSVDTPPNVGSYLGPPRLSTSLLVAEYKCRIKKKKYAVTWFVAPNWSRQELDDMTTCQENIIVSNGIRKNSRPHLETSQIQARHLDMIGKLTWLFVIFCWIKTRPHTTFFPRTCSRVFNMRRLFSFFSSSLSLLRRSLAVLTNSRDDLFNFTSGR